MPGPGKMGALAKPQNAKGTFKRLLSYLLDYPIQIVVIVIALILSSSAAVAGTYMLKPVFNNIADLLSKNAESMLPVAGSIITLAVIYCIGALGTFLANRLLLNVSTNILEKTRNEMFTNLMRLPLNYYDTRTHGEIMSRFSNDTDSLREMLSQGLPQLLTSSISLVGVLVMMIVLSPILTLTVLVLFAIMILVVGSITKKSSKYFKLRQEALAKTNGYAEEMIEGQREVKVFCHEDKVKAEFSEYSETLRSTSTVAMGTAMAMMPIVGNLSYALYAVAAAVGAGLCISGRMDIGTIAAFLTYTRQFSNPLTQISQQFNGILNALAGAERIFALIDEVPEIDEGNVTFSRTKMDADGHWIPCKERTEHWGWIVPKEGKQPEIVELKGDVRFNNVTFAYKEGHDILHNISLYARPGEKIAFVGSTGAGKTTITNLITRFYDVQQGEITYDGINIQNIKKNDLRHSISLVLQDTHLFTGTVKENIAYGKQNATDKEIMDAARLANADYFIRHLPNGYDTVLTADGANLSQGQRQLLAIARAACENAPVLILDEATSSIDTRTEKLIEKGMDQLMSGRTVFVIAHRLSTVRNADAIMVMEKGEIIERGTHNDLIEQKGRYYQLYTGMFELS